MSLADNPFKVLILRLLREADSTLSEHQLIMLLRAHQQSWPCMADEPQLALFQVHFLTMNALYQLQGELWRESIYLQVGPLAIGFVDVFPGDSSGDNSDNSFGNRAGEGKVLSSDIAEEKIRAYYLDWSNYEATDSDDVQRLLSSFWSRYMSEDQQSQAYAVLELEPDAAWPQVQKSYRRMASQHHPDRGGNAQRFLEVRGAYELLSRRQVS